MESNKPCLTSIADLALFASEVWSFAAENHSTCLPMHSHVQAVTLSRDPAVESW